MGILTRLALADFRNYESLELAFEPGLNLLVGDNGQGKSNLLEAIYYLSILRSFRTSRLSHLQRWRTGHFMVRGTLEGSGRRQNLGVAYGGGKRQLRVDGESLGRSSDYIGRLVCVAFVPEDIELVKGAATERRRHLDIVLSQTRPAYLGHLQDYHKALKSRNALLRRDRPDPRAIAAFDGILERTGGALMAARAEFFASFGDTLTAHGGRLYPADRELTLRYLPNTAPTDPADATDPAACSAALHQALADSRDRDLSRGVTHSGPHRDDFTLLLQGKPLGSFGSEGQCRLAALALKMATAEVLFAHKGREHVVLLVDDVIGELDDERRAAFFHCLGEAAQVFLACTSEAVLGPLRPARRYQVDAGAVTLLADGVAPVGPVDEPVETDSAAEGEAVDPDPDPG